MPREPAVPPVRTQGRDPADWSEEHPAYGAISVHHTYGQSGPMFGSALPNNPSWVTLSIHKASRQHSAGRDWHFGAVASLIEITMTHAQWVEAIANPNQGGGVACTLQKRARDDGTCERFPEIALEQDETEGAEAIRTAEKRGREIAASVRALRGEIEAILVERKVPRKTIEEVTQKIGSLERELGSNLPFYLSQVREAGERIVSHVRVETEAIVSGVATKLGFKSLGELASAAQHKLLADKPAPSDPALPPPAPPPTVDPLALARDLGWYRTSAGVRGGQEIGVCWKNAKNETMCSCLQVGVFDWKVHRDYDLLLPLTAGDEAQAVYSALVLYGEHKNREAAFRAHPTVEVSDGEVPVPDAEREP